MSITFTRTVSALLLLACVTPCMSAGQTAGGVAGMGDSITTVPPSPTWLSRRETALLIGTSSGAAVAAIGDVRIRNALRAPSPERHDVRQRVFGVARAAGSPGVFLGSLAMYGMGRATGHDGLADAGFHATEAIVVSGTVTQLIKGIVGRERPYAPDGDPARFAMGRGFSDGTHASFPSGHTSASFAVAAVLANEVARRNASHPWRARLFGAAAYGGAALVGVSRIYHDAHWASDVVAGAGVGTLSGLILTRRAHVPGRGRSRFERWLLGREAQRDR